MPTSKKQTSLMAVLAVCALFIVLLSFLLPYVSVNFFGTHTISGIDFILEAIDDEELPALLAIICPILAVIALLCAFVAIKSTRAAIGTILSSIIGMVVMIVAMSDGDWDIIVALDYAAAGFYLYEAMSFAAIILSAAAMYMEKNENNETEEKIVPISKPAPNPVSKPIPTTRKVCPNPKCRAELDADVAFCRFCGAPLGENEPIPPMPEPEPKPNPVSTTEPTKKKGRVICPHCGARHAEGTEKCKYCGTSIDGTKSISDNSEPSRDPKPDPITMPTPTQKNKKVICPHCGARQPEDSVRCKYCGTSIQ